VRAVVNYPLRESNEFISQLRVRLPGWNPPQLLDE